LQRNGFSVLMIDVRDVGDSGAEDGWTTAGNEEYLDVLGAWDWLIAEKGFTPDRIGLYGGSLGSATALYAFSHEPRVAALFLHATFADVLEAYCDNLSSYGLPRFLGRPTVLMGRLVSSEEMLEHKPSDEIAKAGARPVYIVHSCADHRISVRRGQELAEAARAAGVNVTTWFPEQSEHLQTPALYPEEFESRMVGFFRESLAH
jgi:dipeptidyl aminopeptidase/acylaminoacyl peptidase